MDIPWDVFYVPLGVLGFHNHHFDGHYGLYTNFSDNRDVLTHLSTNHNLFLGIITFDNGIKILCTLEETASANR